MCSRIESIKESRAPCRAVAIQCASFGTVLREQRIRQHLKRPAAVVGDVHVESIEFSACHRIEYLLQERHRSEETRRVNHDGTKPARWNIQQVRRRLLVNIRTGGFTDPSTSSLTESKNTHTHTHTAELLNTTKLHCFMLHTALSLSLSQRSLALHTTVPEEHHDTAERTQIVASLRWTPPAADGLCPRLQTSAGQTSQARAARRKRWQQSTWRVVR